MEGVFEAKQDAFVATCIVPDDSVITQMLELAFLAAVAVNNCD